MLWRPLEPLWCARFPCSATNAITPTVSRLALGHIRVTSKHELKERIMAGIADVNRHPVIHTWSYRLAEAA